MTAQEAIAGCRRVYAIEGARWPIPLLMYLDDPPNEGHIFDWLCPCVGDLLDHLGRASAEISAALSWARQQALDGPNLEAIERMACGFWSRRSPEAPENTAVAQLLFALSRSDRSDRVFFLGACCAPICLLEEIEPERGEVFDRVVSHFSRYVGGGEA